MHIVYWAHSYRQEDADITKHFGVLVEQSERMIANFDPPSESVNESKLSQNLRSCDGMVAVLSWRDRGTSPYLLFEVGLSLRARKPILVFMDDRLPSDVLPPRILQRRFSHRTYFRQFREHTEALRVLKRYMGDPPPARYQPNPHQRSCGLVGLNSLDPTSQKSLQRVVSERGYQLVNLEKIDTANPLAFAKFEHLATLDVALLCADSRARRSTYWAAAVGAAAIPSIAITTDCEYRFTDEFPREFQPRLANSSDGASLEEVLHSEFDLYEQNFLSGDAEAIERYTDMLVKAGASGGHYDMDTRKEYLEVIMGNKYNVSNSVVGVVGDHAHNTTVTQTWNAFEKSVDYPQLANELRRLHEALDREASEPDQKLASGAVAAAAQSARQKDGTKLLEYLTIAGKWAFSVAEKIGVDLAKDALKVALNL